jgi:hypothetical protein
MTTRFLDLPFILKRHSMEKLIPTLLVLPAMAASATLFIYDGFSAGGTTPVVDQYQTSPASTNGSNNSSLIGQNPTALGFSTCAWENISAVAGVVHPRAIDTGLSYTDGSGNTLITTPGGADIFRNGTSSDSTPANQFKQANRTTTGVGFPGSSVYVTGLFQFGAVSLAPGSRAVWSWSPRARVETGTTSWASTPRAILWRARF